MEITLASTVFLWSLTLPNLKKKKKISETGEKRGTLECKFLKQLELVLIESEWNFAWDTSNVQFCDLGGGATGVYSYSNCLSSMYASVCMILSK